MKKLVITMLLSLTALATFATDIAVHAGRIGGTNTSSVGATGTGITIGQQFGIVKTELSYDRALMGDSSLSRYSVVAAYDLAKLASTTVSVKLGAAYIDPTVGTNGYAALFGASVSYSLTKSVALVGDYAYQLGQDRVSTFNGNTLSAGVKYSF